MATSTEDGPQSGSDPSVGDSPAVDSALQCPSPDDFGHLPDGIDFDLCRDLTITSTFDVMLGSLTARPNA